MQRRNLHELTQQHQRKHVCRVTKILSFFFGDSRAVFRFVQTLSHISRLQACSAPAIPERIAICNSCRHRNTILFYHNHFYIYGYFFVKSSDSFGHYHKCRDCLHVLRRQFRNESEYATAVAKEIRFHFIKIIFRFMVVVTLSCRSVSTLQVSLRTTSAR